MKNPLHLRPVETNRYVEAPKILTNSNHVVSGAPKNSSFSGLSSVPPQAAQRVQGFSEKLRPLLESCKYVQSSQ